MNIVAHNLLGMNAERQFGINTRNRAKTTEKLSTGYKINRAADDAAGLAISEKMRRQIRGLSRGKENIQDGVSWVQIGDGAMEEVSDMLHRITELAVKAANETLTDEDRLVIHEEVKHLKSEINRIGVSTQFNDKKIFHTPDVSIDVEGYMDDLSIFNASYDDSTGEVSYGGFTFNGNRIPWTDVDPDMVYQDAITGETFFHEGTYEYTDSANRKFKIECKEGAELPEITRIMDVSASAAGISVDGTVLSWDKFVDEDGISASDGTVHNGYWSLEHEGATISYYFHDDVSDMEDLIKWINYDDPQYKYTWTQEYIGPTETQAVDINSENRIQITQGMVSTLSSGNLSYTVRAGKDAANNEDGIWLEDAQGNRIEGSYRTWSELGIDSWDEGDDISSEIEYIYEDKDGTDDTDLSFSFKLSDVTSVDSVIDGLDGVLLKEQKYESDYDMDAEADSSVSNIYRFQMNGSVSVSFDEEIALGRDFDTQVISGLSQGAVEYDDVTSKSKLSFQNASGTDVITFVGTTSDQETVLADAMKNYAELALQKKQAALLAGEDPDAVQISTPNLTDIVGASNITTSGYFDSTVIIDGNMNLTDGSQSYSPGTVGETYPTAYIDFQGLGTAYSLDDLLGAGFNSTCKTCTNHYSVQFVDTVADGQTIYPEGYTYKKIEHGSNDYTLQIDLQSLRSAGVDTGQEFADALVAITGEAFDFHFTQYASEGSKLYIYDNREQAQGTTSATFDTFPYQPIDTVELSYGLTSNSGDALNLDYAYNYGELKDNIKVSMVQDNAGEYIKVTDANGKEFYEKYDSAQHATSNVADRYNLNVVYELDGVNYTSVDDFCAASGKKAVGTMLENTEIRLNAKDFSHLTIGGNENYNVAIDSEFYSEITKEKLPGIIIQCSSEYKDKIEIPRFELNTMDLKMARASVKTVEKAEATMDMVKTALQRLNEKRATYGVYQNRLEHAYNSNANTEENTTAAESRIRDADMAKEMLAYSGQNILMQVGQSMMAQANQSNQVVLSLLG